MGGRCRRGLWRTPQSGAHEFIDGGDRIRLANTVNVALAQSRTDAGASAAPPAPATPIIFDNYDISGNDLFHVVDSGGIDACLASCKGNADCQAITFNKWNRICFLKSAADTLFLNPAAVSAFVNPNAKPTYSQSTINLLRYPNHGFPKTADLTDAENKNDCENVCVNTGWCVAETFFRSSRKCMMLRTTGEYFLNNDADSGAKRQD